MVRFKEKGFSIEIETEIFPHEDYLETMEELINLLQSQDYDMRTNCFYTTELLKSMLPSLEQAKAMAALDVDDDKVRELHGKFTALSKCK